MSVHAYMCALLEATLVSNNTGVGDFGDEMLRRHCLKMVGIYCSTSAIRLK